VEESAGAPAWGRLLEEAGIPGKVFVMTRTYPDETFLKLVTTSSTLLNKPASALVE
jgi:hypothetical protein